MAYMQIIPFSAIILISVALVLSYMTIMWMEAFTKPRMRPYQSNQIGRKRSSSKLILFYTTFFGNRPWGLGMRNCSCTMDCCELTYNISKYNKSDIVIFHGRDMISMRELERLNKIRPKNQLWVYFIMENPKNTPDIRSLNRFFNLSSSYRLDSDLRFPYFFHYRLLPSEVKLPSSNNNHASGKTRQIAWAVSNCGSARDQLAKKLHDYGLQVDNLGSCRYPYVNSRPVPRSRKAPYNEYKFYFAAENALCKDYVTEKYWDRMYNRWENMIPIVLGGSNYSDPKLAIPGSFIDALKFPSPKKLAEYLLLLDKNDTLYNEYFKWRPYWKVMTAAECSPIFCDACDKLHSNAWQFKGNPLISTINIAKECKPNEEIYFNWLKEKK